ncbi:MAG: hypothetical protein CVU27_03110 [Betaproteobacteria bacterium HGW-Betaproteobacteria-20]|nr:MAG: hypothetical protein CVU27_03110 [Betaproteobacteria bacterium HGW-Betaproteobacteria-20]
MPVNRFPEKLIIAAISARAYAEAAVLTGYQVITLDAFADADTRCVAEQSFKVKINANGVDDIDFKHLFSQINLDNVTGFLYGSLFDANPELLAWVADKVPLIGNSPEVMQLTKSFGFFELLDALEIQYPEVQICEQKYKLSLPRLPEFVEEWLKSVPASNLDCHFPINSRGIDMAAISNERWLSKKLGGTGGMHIKPATQGNSGDYFQRQIDGRPISMLFVADGKLAQLIGFNEQFIAPTSVLPYRFAGAVGGVKLLPDIQQQLLEKAQQLTSALGLRGINSLDAILAYDSLWILELNPRLSATFYLYPNLLPVHLQGCAGELMDVVPQISSACAQLILYAENDMDIPADFVWPDWVADIPATGIGESSVKIHGNSPICTVLAKAESAVDAHALVLQRYGILKKRILSSPKITQ